ncbi:ACP S-malonyltransferase, partial [bacterium]
AGALDFRAAVGLVQLRGQLMQAAVPQGSGGMAAILGLDDAQVREVCELSAQGEVVEAVNFNGPGQVVIAGHTSAIGRAIALSKERGAKRALPLAISVPCHSSLLRDAAARLGEALRATNFDDPRIRFVSPFDVAEHARGGELAAMLEQQLAAPVRWTETVQFVAGLGATRFVECGPGEVLTGMNKRILKGRDGVQCLAFNDPATLEKAQAALQEAA